VVIPWVRKHGIWSLGVGVIIRDIGTIRRRRTNCINSAKDDTHGLLLGHILNMSWYH
jgi:hypothetical protein